MKDNARTIKYDSITSYAKEYGVEYLSNENLIASIIGIDPMLQGNEPIRKIFDGSHSLRKASKRTLQELTSIKGIGEKKATAILAAFELGRRFMKEKSQELTDLEFPRHLQLYFTIRQGFRNRRILSVLYG